MSILSTNVLKSYPRPFVILIGVIGVYFVTFLLTNLFNIILATLIVWGLTFVLDTSISSFLLSKVYISEKKATTSVNTSITRMKYQDLIDIVKSMNLVLPEKGSGKKGGVLRVDLIQLIRQARSGTRNINNYLR
ncbi:unnamed protein product [marine sediment metagenome]|uniref:Uncharacterized protein n=1 Tax=marine sediment metagenome TaxID=412755 RepID=X1D7A5_9ZZZZ